MHAAAVRVPASGAATAAGASLMHALVQGLQLLLGGPRVVAQNFGRQWTLSTAPYLLQDMKQLGCDEDAVNAWGACITAAAPAMWQVCIHAMSRAHVNYSIGAYTVSVSLEPSAAEGLDSLDDAIDPAC